MLSFIPVIAPVFQLRDALGGMVYVSVPGGVPRSPKPAPCIFQLRDALGGMAHFSVPGGISDRRGQRIQATLTTTGCTIPAVAALPPASRPTTQILLPFSHSGQFPLEAICLEAHGVSSFIHDTEYLQVLDLCFADLEVHLLIPHLVLAGLETYICPVGPRLGLMLCGARRYPSCWWLVTRGMRSSSRILAEASARRVLASWRSASSKEPQIRTTCPPPAIHIPTVQFHRLPSIQLVMEARCSLKGINGGGGGCPLFCPSLNANTTQPTLCSQCTTYNSTLSALLPIHPYYQK